MSYFTVLNYLRTGSIEEAPLRRHYQDVASLARDLLSESTSGDTSVLAQLLDDAVKAVRANSLRHVALVGSNLTDDLKKMAGRRWIKAAQYHLTRRNLREIYLLERMKCGDSRLSAVPTAVWTVGSAAIAHRLVTSLFRRFIFRRVPLWEVTLQHLLFMWMVIYSLHFWALVVNIVKFLIKYCYEMDDSVPTVEDIESQKIMQQWVIWMCAVVPLVLYLHMRPKLVPPPLMIWITTSPWQRREMGAYGYYLNRPLSSLQRPNSSTRDRDFTLRRAYSDSKAIIKEPQKKRRNSKSV